MKNYLLLLFLITTISFAQNSFQGTAIYESKTDMKSIGFDMPGVDEETKAKMIKKMAAAFEKTYILNFNTFESVFEEEQKLQIQKSNVTHSGGEEIIYKNIKEQIQLTEQESFSKNFLVSEELKKWDWKLIDETKKIGDYNCLKAMAIIPVSENELAEYEKEKKLQSNNKTTFIQISEPKPETIIVWYALEIPVANGPFNYWGLPGLILETNDGSTTMLCSKIILNPKDKIAVKRPTKGKKISRKEFEKMEEDKLNSMKDENGVIQIQTFGN